MPRKPRIEYAGAVYHVLNRGNYRQDLFTVSGSAARFEWVRIDSLRCGVGNCWFGEHLYMGSIYSISKAVSAELGQGSRRKRMWRKLRTPFPFHTNGYVSSSALLRPPMSHDLNWCDDRSKLPLAH